MRNQVQSLAPAGLPAEIQARLEQAALRAVATPKIRERLEHDGLEPAPPQPLPAFAAAVREESAFWARKIRELDIRME